jgi:hypothetical protein
MSTVDGQRDLQRSAGILLDRPELWGDKPLGVTGTPAVGRTMPAVWWRSQVISTAGIDEA